MLLALQCDLMQLGTALDDVGTLLCSKWLSVFFIECYQG